MLIRRKPLKLDASIYSAEWDVPRSAGCHLMQVVELLEKDRDEVTGNRQKTGGWAADSLEAARLGGFIHEHFMAWHIIQTECDRQPSMLIRPGEYFWCARCDEVLPIADPKRTRCLDKQHRGIFATPDALRIDTWRLKEWKFTWKSMRRCGGDEQWSEEEQDWVSEDTAYEHLTLGLWRWPAQTMSYCWLTETRGADQEVMFVCGDYTDRQPALMRYEMDFTQRELEENWLSIVNKAREMEWI